MVHERLLPCPYTNVPDPGGQDPSIADSVFSWHIFLQHQIEAPLGGNGGEDVCPACKTPASRAHLPLPLATCAKGALASFVEFSI